MCNEYWLHERNKKNIAKGLVNEMENEKKVMHNSDEENDEILKGIEKIRNDNEEEKKNKTIVESNLEEKTNNNDDTSSTLKKKKKKIKNELPEDSVWQKLQDPNTSKYYYFNSITQETTWISPMDPDFIEKKKKEKMDNLQQNQKLQQQQQWGGYTDLSQQQPYFGNDITYQYNNGEAPPGLENEVSNQQNTQQQPTYEDYTVTGAFNTSTGRFQVNDVRANGEYFNDISKATRQCDAYFDYNQYQDQRNANINATSSNQKKQNKDRQFTKKELAKLLKLKKQRKQENLIKKYAD